MAISLRQASQASSVARELSCADAFAASIQLRASAGVCEFEISFFKRFELLPFLEAAPPALIDIDRRLGTFCHPCCRTES